MTGVLIGRESCEDRDAGRTPCADEGSGVILHKPRNARGYEKLREAKKDPPLEASEAAWSPAL